MPTDKKDKISEKLTDDILDIWLKENNLVKLHGAFLQLKTLNTKKLGKWVYTLRKKVEGYRMQVEDKLLKLMYSYVKNQQFAGKDAQAIHQQLLVCSERYAKTLNSKQVPDLMGLLKYHPLDDNIDDYASDNSDDNLEPPKKYDNNLSVNALRRAKQKYQRQKQKYQDKLDKNPKLRVGIQKTFRQYPQDPDAGKVVQLVNKIREKYRNKKSTFEEYQEMAAIRHPKDTWTKQVENDFKVAQKAFRTGDFNTLNGLKTQFAIAQYRGITFNNEIFSSEQRKASRDRFETGDAIYSMSVVHAAGVPLNNYFEGDLSDEQKKNLEATAKALKKTLLAKRKSKKVTVNGFEYDNMGIAIQNLYTIDYQYFFNTLKAYMSNEAVWKKYNYQPIAENFKAIEPHKQNYPAYVKNKHGSYQAYLENVVKPENERREAYFAKIEQQNLIKKCEQVYGVLPPSDWALYDGLMNAHCPFVSMSDAPRAPLKYGYGMKFYEGNYQKRLLPAWNSQGRCARPYSGKVFGTLHSLQEFIEDAPMHVPSLAASGQMKADNMVLTELEHTFPAYVPADRVALEFICKFPSFDGQWQKDIHLTKYGLSKNHYDKLAKVIKSDDVQHDGFCRPLSAWLVNFQEARLVELMRQKALEDGKILVTLDKNGQLSRTVSYFQLSRKDNSSFLSFEGNNKVNKFTFEELDSRDKKGNKDDHTGLNKKVKNNKPKPEDKPKNKPILSSYTDRIRASNFYVSSYIPGDGNCFFTALLYALRQNPMTRLTGNQFNNAVDFRQTLVDQYNQHNDIRNQQGITPNYIAEMRQAATYAAQVSRWGSDAELILFARAYDINVTVFSPMYPNGQATFTAANERANNHRPHLYLVHSYGNHWEFAVPK